LYVIVVLGVSMVEFIFVGFGITNAIVYLSVSEWLRKIISGISDEEFKSMLLLQRFKRDNTYSFRRRWFGKIVRCHACCGFWVGIFLSYLGYRDIFESVPRWVEIEIDICGGFLLSCSNFLIWLIARKLGAEEL